MASDPRTVEARQRARAKVERGEEGRRAAEEMVRATRVVRVDWRWEWATEGRRARENESVA